MRIAQVKNVFDIVVHCMLITVSAFRLRDCNNVNAYLVMFFRYYINNLCQLLWIITFVQHSTSHVLYNIHITISNNMLLFVQFIVK